MTKSRILIADSNQGSLAQLRDYLAAQDGTRAVDTATDGVEALKLLRSQRYDVLITPGRSGSKIAFCGTSG